MNCTETRTLFSSHLDGALDGAANQSVTEHLRECRACAQHHAALVKTQSLVMALGRKPAPPELALKIRVALSQERSMSFRRQLQGFVVRTENAFNAFMLPASAGLVTAIVMFGLFVGFFVQAPIVSAANDVPTSLYLPPRLASAPFADNITGGPVVIEALVDASGRMESYRIIAGEDSDEIRRQLDRSLLFTQFQPAMAFGSPTSGRVVISFSNVNVRG
jgi:anti-sigma factor RsiW